MRLVLVSTQVPFVSGGAELLARNLKAALEAAGHEAALIEIPPAWYPAEALFDAVLANRLLDVSTSFGSRIDRMIGLKFPAWLAHHPNKVLWIVHQHRQAYDLWDNGLSDLLDQPLGEAARALVQAADRRVLEESQAVYTIAGNVSTRLERYCGVKADPLYSPPDAAEDFRTGPFEDFLFFPSRLSGLKRQELVLEALAQCREPVVVRFAGRADVPGGEKALAKKAESLGVADRVTWLGGIDNTTKLDLYSRALGVVYPPADEDYGYVTLEAMLAGKPVVTTEDAGGPTEFVIDGETGLVAPPTAAGLAAALDRLWAERRQAEIWGAAGRDRYHALPIGWPAIVERLLA